MGEHVRIHGLLIKASNMLYRYLQPALKRINSLISGYQFSIIDIYAMQNMCAYEARRSPDSRNSHKSHLTFESRPSHWGIPAFVPCSRKMNGNNTTIRQFFSLDWITNFGGLNLSTIQIGFELLVQLRVWFPGRARAGYRLRSRTSREVDPNTDRARTSPSFSFPSLGPFLFRSIDRRRFCIA